MELRESIVKRLRNREQTIKTADVTELYNACIGAVMDEIADKWSQNRDKNSRGRQAAYLSAEFLIGRMVFNNLSNLCLNEKVDEILGTGGRSIREFEQIDDAALGNGGLGRLAACFLDSAAQLSKPLIGYGIRYKYGLFRQQIEDGFQTEYPDDWQRFGTPWSYRRDDLSYIIPFGDGAVKAVAFDMPVIPYASDKINTLRLFESHAINEFDFELFNNGQYQSAVASREKAERIHMSLYPNDERRIGKILRLKQEYFFSSAAVQDMLRSFEKNIGKELTAFSDYYAIQLNDTHPVIAVPELIYRLTERGMSFVDAVRTAKNTFSYTNHTVMPEALEKWDMKLMREVVPHLVPIIKELQSLLIAEMQALKVSEKVIENISITDGRTVNMANLAVFMSKKTNGVAKIHTDILKTRVLKDWYSIYPDRFVNKTNGITQRRWLRLCNPALSEFIGERIGYGFITDLDRLKALEKYAHDGLFLNRLAEVKRKNKARLADWLRQTYNIEVDPKSVFDIQAKRLHEYKRQLLNAFGCMYIYYGIKDGSITLPWPLTVIFAAKAAPGYARAKAIIKYINEAARIINSDSEVSDKLKVVFIPNYNVSVAEMIMPAADLSEQISTAGTEASGTGNMKFMLNGTVTLGTYDGANIEIAEAAGIDNEYIFGLTAEEVEQQSKTYDPMKIYKSNKAVKRVVDTLISKEFDDGGNESFKELYGALLKGASWHSADNYFVLAELESYVERKLDALRDYERLPEVFTRKGLMNIANAGRFSSDRTIAEYCSDIWHI